MNNNNLAATQKNWASNKDLEDIILERLESRCFGDRTIEIYGGAYHLARQGKDSLTDIGIGAVCAIKNAKHWTPDVPSSVVAQRYCSLFFVDYMLIEAYAGIRF